MKTFISHKDRLKLMLVIGALLIVGIFAGMSTDVFAGGGVGGGGGAGGCTSCGGASTNYGYGWYSFSTSGSGPGGFRDGQTWASVRGTCAGNDSVIAFVIYTSRQTIGSSVVYRYVAPDFTGYWKYFGNNGGSWLSFATAKARYDSIPASLKGGYTWGSNVAWFCYSSGSFSLRAGSYIATSPSPSSWGSAGRTINVYPGTHLYWRHNVDNTGNISVSFQRRIGVIQNGPTWYTGWSGKSLGGPQNDPAPSGGNMGVPMNAPNGSLWCEFYQTDRTSSGNSAYVTAARACGKAVYNWSPNLTTRLANASSGDNVPNYTLKFEHQLKNNGPTATDVSMSYKTRIVKVGLSGGVTSSTAPNITQVLAAYDANSASNPTRLKVQETYPTIPAQQASGQIMVPYSNFTSDSYAHYTLTQNEVNSWVCSYITSSNGGTNMGVRWSGDWVRSTPVCVFIPYNYSLTPNVTNVPTAVQPGNPVTYTGSVSNSGPTKSRSTEWRLVKFILPPATAIPATSTGSASPEAYYGHSATKIAGATGRVFNVTNTQVTTGSSVTQGLEPGSLVCFALSVAPYSQANSNWRYGRPSCAEVAKASYISISGGDLMVGRNAVPSPSSSIEVNRFSISGNTYGSWSEYAAFAPSTSNIATGGNLASTTTRSTPSPSGNLAQPLTFANNKTSPNCTTIDGCFNNSMGARSDIYSKYTTKPDIYTAKSSTTSLNLSGLTAGKYYYKLSSPLNISGNLAKGVSVIIDTTAGITITGDIKYAQGPYTNISDLPQLILATKGNIRINNTVGQVDSWLYSTGTVSTCDAIQAPASYTAGLKVKGACDNASLITNGPLSTGHLQLRRTHGADPTQGGLQQTSEAFNLRPDSYLWSHAQSQNPRLITTAFTRELPPRL